MLTYTQKANYATLSEQQKIKRKERDVRHYAPANKEWKNSIYAFNKSSLYYSGAKDQIASNMIRNYFNLIPKPKKITKSKRMRDLLRRKSTRQLLVSKPEIKQNNDKAIITVYTHDREKASYLRKLFFLSRWVNSNVLGLNRLNLEKKKSYRYLINKYNANYLLKYRVFSKFRRMTYRQNRIFLKKSLRKYRIKSELIKNTVKSLLGKKQYVSNLLFYHFLRWALSIFKIKVNFVPDVMSVVKKSKKGNKIETINIFNLVLLKTKKVKEKKKNKVLILNKKNIKVKGMEINGKINLKIIKTTNILLLQHLMLNINKFLNVEQGNKIQALFTLFRKKYFNVLVRKQLKKEILIIKYLSKLHLNKFKYNIFLPGLKNLLSNIYNKKIILNIVSLKYLHLNSDLFTEAISIKLRDRTKSLLRVLRKSFSLLKTFKVNNKFLIREKNKNYIIKDIKTYFGKYNVINGNVLNLAFKEMFKNVDYSNKKSIKGLNSSIKDTLISLKYKWVTGIRVEAAGRLTKRYAAARALFKYKYRGTLKNLEHLRNIENKLQTPGVFMLRGEARPNTQYSFVPSKRRIGAFGIKSWISNS